MRGATDRNAFVVIDGGTRCGTGLRVKTWLSGTGFRVTDFSAVARDEELDELVFGRGTVTGSKGEGVRAAIGAGVAALAGCSLGDIRARGARRCGCGWTSSCV